MPEVLGFLKQRRRAGLSWVPQVPEDLFFLPRVTRGPEYPEVPEEPQVPS